jgi:3-methylfumaryl-CoA hydratase
MMPSGDLLVSHLTVDAAPVQALAALFDDGLPVPGVGDELPALWHWAALARWPGAQATGPDGHPATGGFLPDVGKPRRMFAGGSVTLHGPLVVGTEVRREERVLAVTPKTGRQGDFVLVQVESRIFDERDVLALVEVQDLVYRDARTAEPAATTGDAGLREPAPALLAEVDGTWVFQTDPSRLMRFSSATSNGHRIHYDQPYAVNVEGYPGLVVHGGSDSSQSSGYGRRRRGGARRWPTGCSVDNPASHPYRIASEGVSAVTTNKRGQVPVSAPRDARRMPRQSSGRPVDVIYITGGHVDQTEGRPGTGRLGGRLHLHRGLAPPRLDA